MQQIAGEAQVSGGQCYTAAFESSSEQKREDSEQHRQAADHLLQQRIERAQRGCNRPWQYQQKQRQVETKQSKQRRNVP
ncbi:hypothetical protein GCM10011352_14870 [Marinobacterium zhoushanense]|uniref:Uncharacterized protein n=1 Tax=Marinobacterium zhoushanense TaxID=1679163 RepID=A0ABQ1K9W0_9GAMM|nr:hypothetical protein GCM10011352_14870 [Marinobacterium zhoushanense]